MRVSVAVQNVMKSRIISKRMDNVRPVKLKAAWTVRTLMSVKNAINSGTTSSAMAHAKDVSLKAVSTVKP